MKIAFLCGSLEPGRDGVGDYTQRLAIELFQQGHKIAVLAINDQHILEIVEDKIPLDSKIGIPLLRLPSIWPVKGRFKKAKDWLDIFKPDWVSLQFVIFSFHYKGLPLGLTKRFINLGREFRWHIMFHELWVGMPIHASKKHILWGWFQRCIIRSMIFKLQPRVIQTQTLLYQTQLKKLNVKAQILPLFSNIPLIIKGSSNSSLKKNTIEIVLVLFGNLHSHAQVEPLVYELAKFKRVKGINVCLQIIGHSGPELSTWIKICNKKEIKINILGELSPEDISKVLQNADIGITTTAIPMLQKSGSVAAMREHSLPVLCISKPWRPRGTNIPEILPFGMFKFCEGILDICLNTPRENISGIGVEKVSRLFIEALQLS